MSREIRRNSKIIVLLPVRKAVTDERLIFFFAPRHPFANRSVGRMTGKASTMKQFG